ncbi:MULTISPECIES: HTH-type transcriptional activator RhaS [Enterobacteriaceae]|uniref:HTH-type transcriptional activator RhaS n=1 Tax=Enterobacteriaceae TaxID=543 RepID=UPI000272A4C9|nr:HTH-type transcriptional activator RhaS [Enterobacter sp. Ag1]EJF31115.1 transcriptional activator RhaS [Enterobacter sp. Ag1]
MTVLHSVDFFPDAGISVAIEPRQPQPDFPEHIHDFNEIIIVEHGTGSHIFNGQPYTLSGGSICFVRDHDHHQFEHTENLCLTNILYREPEAFCFLSGLHKLLPQEQDGYYPAHWRVNQGVLRQVKGFIEQFEALSSENTAPALARRELLFMQLLVLLSQANQADNRGGADERLNQLLLWLEDHSSEEVCWEQLAASFTLSLRTLHRLLNQKTGLTPQRYLNRLRLMKARYLLRHSEESVTNIAFQCGFGDSNHFSTLFKREFSYSPRVVRQGRDTPIV